MKEKERKTLADNPKYKNGDIIEITKENKGGPGIKDLKVGKYIILDFRKSYFTSNMVYEFKSTRSNSKYIYHFSQQFVEENSKKI